MTDETKTFDPPWYRAQVQLYHDIYPCHEEMAHCLETVLRDLGKAHDLLLIVQARAKNVANFAEKIQRKGKHYTDPLHQLSDLCGARVIAHTLADVEIVCRYIEQHFEVLPEESDNAQERLKAIEFGYLSRHYEVRFKEGMFSENDVPPALIARHFKAEIQVRTILQHAWADIAHEASYKSSFTLPHRWARELAQLAAVLEAADADFDRLQSGLKEYAASYGAYYDEAELRRHIDKLAIALEADTENAGVAHRIAKMAMSLGDWERAINVLQPFAATGNAALLRDLGVSLCKRHAREPEGEAYASGQTLLVRATERNPADVDAWASLAGTWRTRQHAMRNAEKAEQYRAQARAHYRKAFEVDAADPYALGNFIEYELAAHPDLDLIPYFRPPLEQAVRRCRAQAGVGVNMPWAYFDLGKFELLLNEPHTALADYAKGVASSSAAFFIESALRSFHELRPAQSRLPGFDWIEGFLQLACAIRFGSAMPDMATPPASLPPGPVVIVAGYTAALPTDGHRALLSEACANFRGTLISGGTRAGVCELVGELQAAHPDALHTLGYLPQQIPGGVELDNRYHELRRSAGTDFSPLEVLHYWRDIHSAGRVPQTRLLALGGGRIAAAECIIALALGVPVGIVVEAGGEPAKLLADPYWASNPLLRTLSPDSKALREFLESFRSIR